MVHRAFSLAILLTCGAASAQVTLGPVHVPPTPWYLPRAAFLSAIVSPSFSPAVRAAWELTLYQDDTDALVFPIEGGLAYAAGTPSVDLPDRRVKLTSLYQNSVMAGLGYRKQTDYGFLWGFTLLTGPMWYGAHYVRERATNLALIGAVEGRAEFGWKFGDIVWGVQGGVIQSYEHPLLIPAAQALGGPVFGVFAEWR